MNIFKQLIVSLYSPKDIATFRNQGIGKTIAFVFLLTLISVIPAAYHFSSTVNSGIQAFAETIKGELPAFEISNGTLTSEADEPVIVNKEGFQIVLDDTGKWKSSDIAAQTENGIGLLKNDLVFVTAGQAQSNPYSILEGFSITSKDIDKFLDSADSALVIVLPIIVVMMYLFTAALNFIKISFLALFGLVFKNVLQKPISYRHSWRLTAYSITLPAIFFTIMDAFEAYVPFGILISWFVSLIMLYLAIKEIPKSE
ncbi:DUF1189 domain-containing protein [Peribacillus cavernae]|uniref:DUF1189 domain-containing protein n=1 Tax=Peribacillus cavernae TaxID=1674310 RepID=A0A3S0VLU6_9BACI|nr:DUF1189 domain-containing protein [Peribacillus cavernae]MDQ0218295.1 hypothetical protein [Peribacillus cavernae]RUQ28423.1 DUF1189 domain-containing protein [Peribacillus cavernae]